MEGEDTGEREKQRRRRTKRRRKERRKQKGEKNTPKFVLKDALDVYSCLCLLAYLKSLYSIVVQLSFCLLFSLSLSRFDTLTVDLISHLDI